MPHFTGVAGRVYYRFWEVPDARAGIVFLHGYGEHSGLYHRFAAALNHRGINLWALDEIGHGLTEGVRGFVGSLDDLEANGRRLAQVATDAYPDLPLIVAGHSLGGATAALLVARDPAPFRGAVLSGTPLSAPRWIEELDPAVGLALEPTDLSSDPFYLDALANDPLAFTDSEASPLDALPPAWKELGERFSDVGVPVLLVHGDRDPVAPIDGNRDWAARLSRVRLFEVPGGRHDVLNETTHESVAAAIAEFTLEVTAPAVAI